jgi:hypothetical protein
MPMNDVIDESYGSGNPTKTGIPMVNAPTLPVWEEGFVDIGGTLATVGQVVVKSFLAANTGGANAAVSATANQVLLEGEYGVVTKAALSAQAASGVMQQRGPVQAYCTTTSTAIAAGTLLSADGAGNFTVAPGSPTPGQLLARAMGALAGSTSTPTLVQVHVGHA